MDDIEILKHIGELANEELALEESHIGRGLSDDEKSRMHAIEVALDQSWDLLRQRKARREAGQNPDGATMRSESVVEHYQQ